MTRQPLGGEVGRGLGNFGLGGISKGLRGQGAGQSLRR